MRREKKKYTTSKWVETTDHIQRAKAVLERYDVFKVHPDAIIPNPHQEEWTDLLKSID